MNANELLGLAQSSAPELMEKTALALKLAERLYPEAATEMVAEMQEILAHAGEKAKTAGLARDIYENAKGGVKNTPGMLAGTVAAGLGIAAATDLYNVCRRGLTSGRNWKRMIEANPGLKEKDQAKVRTHFNALHRVAPDIASNPLAAGAAVYNLIQAGELEGQYLKTLTDQAKMQKDLVEAKFAPFGGKGVKVDIKNESPRTGGDRKNHPA